MGFISYEVFHDIMKMTCNQVKKMKRVFFCSKRVLQKFVGTREKQMHLRFVLQQQKISLAAGSSFHNPFTKILRNWRACEDCIEQISKHMNYRFLKVFMQLAFVRLSGLLYSFILYSIGI